MYLMKMSLYLLLKNYNYINIFIDIVFTCHLRMFTEIYNNLITESNNT